MCGRYNSERTAPVPVVVHHRPNSVALMRRCLILWRRQGRRRNGSIRTVGEKRMHGTINPASDHRCTPVRRTILLLGK